MIHFLFQDWQRYDVDFFEQCVFVKWDQQIFSNEWKSDSQRKFVPSRKLVYQIVECQAWCPGKTNRCDSGEIDKLSC